ncbi:GNAT family N-acetyltransferase [Algihabitans albus]|uniref:GNAT family N-acetyltransferase n=1 Tax=Algihabitans albus TaxID=2164067 RepID=UPI0013C30CDE|nr:GNAT family N-acetyltransferase [Algihabitans albus]
MVYVTEAGLEDIEDLVPLALEMERFYGADNKIDATVAAARLRAALPLPADGALLLARSAEPLGFAMLYRMFPGRDLEPVWYLKELFVVAAGRGQGVGERLMQAAAAAVVRRGGQRLEFTTGSENAAAQRFYDRLQIPVVGKVFYRLEDEGLERLARFTAT